MLMRFPRRQSGCTSNRLKSRDRLQQQLEMSVKFTLEEFSFALRLAALWHLFIKYVVTHYYKNNGKPHLFLPFYCSIKSDKAVCCSLCLFKVTRSRLKTFWCQAFSLKMLLISPLLYTLLHSTPLHENTLFLCSQTNHPGEGLYKNLPIYKHDEPF